MYRQTAIIVSAPPIEISLELSWSHRTLVTWAECPRYFLNLEWLPSLSGWDPRALGHHRIASTNQHLRSMGTGIEHGTRRAWDCMELRDEIAPVSH